MRRRFQFFVAAVSATLVGAMIAVFMDRAATKPIQAGDAVTPAQAVVPAVDTPTLVLSGKSLTPGSNAQNTSLGTQAVGIPVASQMLVNMSKASDLRVFVESIKGQAGAALYILPVLMDCGGLREKAVSQQLQALQTKAAFDPSLTKQAADAAWLIKRCEGFSNAELSNTEIGHVGSVARQRDDLYRLRSELKPMDVRNTAESASAASKLLATRDPMLIAAAFAVTQTRDTKADEVIAYVDGQRYAGSGQSLYWSAQQLAICQFTMTCDLRDTEVAWACALENECFNNRESFIRREYADPAEAAKLNQLTARMLEILERGDVKRLMPVS